MNKKTFLLEVVPDKLQTLKEGTMSPIWGLMTAQHMVEHLLTAFALSLGKLRVTCITPAEKLEKAQAFLMSDLPFRTNVKVKGFLPVGKTMPLAFKDFEQAKAALIKAINSFYTLFDNHPHAAYVHPIFGELTFAEWEVFHTKHCQHHLRQFDLLPLE